MNNFPVSLRCAFLWATLPLLSACPSEEPANDIVAASVNVLSISITNPAGVSAIQTPDLVISISGTVNSDSGISSITWQNDRGSSGDADGGENWTTGNIVLQIGTNIITVTVTDTTGKTASKGLTVERENTAALVDTESMAKPVLMYSYHSDLGNAAPVKGASIFAQAVYLFVEPGSEWQNRGIEKVTLLCCKGQSGPGKGQSYFRGVRLASSPWNARFDLTGFEGGGIRRTKIYAHFSDGTQSERPVFDFTVARTEMGSNNAPIISGSPIGSATVGNKYNFRPKASDSDGDTLAFSIQNKPSWAAFNQTTGRLHGKPKTNDVGTFGSITISVSDGTSSASLPPFEIAVAAISNGSASLSWAIPTQRIDNTPLYNLAGFNIYYGQTSGDYGNKTTVSNPGIANYVVENLSTGPWYFVVTALDSDGLESNPSNEGSKSF